MEILHTFGVDPRLLVAQIINFLLILFLLQRFLYKPLLETLEARRKTIAQGLQSAEEGRQLLEKAAEKERLLLKKAQEEAKKLLEEAKNQRHLLLKETEEATKKQAEKILAEAKSQIAYETKAAEKRLTSHVSELAVQFLEKSLTGLLSQKDQNEIVKHAVKRIKQKAD